MADKEIVGYVSVEVTPDTSKFGAALESQLRSIKNINAQITPDSSKLGSNLNNQLKNVKFTPDTSKFGSTLNNQLKTIKEKKIPITTDDMKLRQTLMRIENQYEKVISSIGTKFAQIGTVGLGLGTSSIFAFLKKDTVEAKVLKVQLEDVKNAWAKVGEKLAKANFGGKTLGQWAEKFASTLNSLSVEKIERIAKAFIAIAATGAALKAFAGIKGFMENFERVGLMRERAGNIRGRMGSSEIEQLKNPLRASTAADVGSSILAASSIKQASKGIKDASESISKSISEDLKKSQSILKKISNTDFGRAWSPSFSILQEKFLKAGGSLTFPELNRIPQFRNFAKENDINMEKLLADFPPTPVRERPKVSSRQMKEFVRRSKLSPEDYSSVISLREQEVEAYKKLAWKKAPTPSRDQLAKASQYIPTITPAQIGEATNLSSKVGGFFNGISKVAAIFAKGIGWISIAVGAIMLAKEGAEWLGRATSGVKNNGVPEGFGSQEEFDKFLQEGKERSLRVALRQSTEGTERAGKFEEEINPAAGMLGVKSKGYIKDLFNRANEEIDFLNKAIASVDEQIKRRPSSDILKQEKSNLGKLVTNMEKNKKELTREYASLLGNEKEQKKIIENDAKTRKELFKDYEDIYASREKELADLNEENAKNKKEKMVKGFKAGKTNDIQSFMQEQLQAFDESQFDRKEAEKEFRKKQGDIYEEEKKRRMEWETKLEDVNTSFTEAMNGTRDSIDTLQSAVNALYGEISLVRQNAFGGI